MTDEVGVAQARQLLRELSRQVTTIRQKLDKAERRHRRTSARGAMIDRRQVAGLRQELCEARRLIDALHRRYPSARLGTENFPEAANPAIPGAEYRVRKVALDPGRGKRTV
jgi:hypothetical protein